MTIGHGGSPLATSRQRALRALRSDAKHQALHARVLAGDLSPHAAMVLAGLRPRTATIRLDSPTAALKSLLRHFTRPDLLKALEEMDA